MIIREIIKYPEILEDGRFDFFNDSKDTIQFLRMREAQTSNEEEKTKSKEIREKLEQKYQAYLDNFFKRNK